MNRNQKLSITDYNKNNKKHTFTELSQSATFIDNLPIGPKTSGYDQNESSGFYNECSIRL